MSRFPATQIVSLYLRCIAARRTFEGTRRNDNGTNDVAVFAYRDIYCPLLQRIHSVNCCGFIEFFGTAKSRSKLVPRGEPFVCLSRPFLGSAGGVSSQHRPGLPSSQRHEVGLLAALNQPVVSKPMSKHVRMDSIQPGLHRTFFDDLGNAIASQRSGMSKPKLWSLSLAVLSSHTKISVQGNTNLVSEL